MTVYHGTILEIKKPDVSQSRKNVDFGSGFYVTTFQKQAEKWAIRKALRASAEAIVNEYEVDDLAAYKVKTFGVPSLEWPHFVCDCRNGLDVYKEYDVIIGSVANDEVMKCVRMFYGIDNMDYRYLVENLMENEPELFVSLPLSS